MTGQDPARARDAVNAAAGALGQTPRSARKPSTLRRIARTAGNAAYAGLVAATKAATVIEFVGEMVKGEVSSGQVRPHQYRRQHGGHHGNDDLGHYAPEADPTSPHAYGHPHGQGWAHGPQTSHHSGPAPGR